jgi:hypothetical protein
MTEKQHGEYGLTVLHDIAHDAKFVKVTTASLGTNLFLEGDLYVGDMVTIPA